MPPKKSQQNTAQQPTLSSFFKSSPIKRSNPTPASKPTETINLSDDSDGEPAAKKAKFNGSGSGGKSKGKGKETEKEGGSESEDLPEALGYDPPAKEKKDVKVSEFAASFYANPSTTTKVPTTSATKQTFFTPKPSTSKRPPLPPKTSTASAVQKLGKFKIGAPALGPLTQEEERRKEKWRKQALGVNMGRRRVEELVDVETEEADKVEENEDENEDERPVKGKGKASVGKSNGKGKGKGKAQEPKYTPLELQYLEIKKANPDILLLIEVGYKYKFLGTDALHATKILSIACFPSHSFPTAMIPTHRLNFHVRRLVLAGHKVGIVRQVDTAALKKATGKSGTFRRELREVYTAATWVEDLGSSATSEGLEGGQVHSWVLAVVEDDVGQNGNVEIGLVALCPQSGTVLWEEFGDGGVRGELETRLGHLECVGGEVVLGLDGEVGVETERAIGRWALDGGKGPRIERAKKKRDAKEDFGFVTEFWGRKMKDGEEVLNVDRDEEMGENVILKEVVDLPGRVISALALLIRHLEIYSLTPLLHRPHTFLPFASHTSMLLSPSTLSNLDLYTSPTPSPPPTPLTAPSSGS